jgi:alpha-tubulin suppressor-like RCC1 family protein
VTAAGGALCWGLNTAGRLGNNSTVTSLVPVQVTGRTSGIASISAGNGHTCALTTAGGALCWGTNDNGQIGNNSTTQRLVPVQVQGLTSGVASISAGGNHTCTVATSGGALCWGRNWNGQLGDGTTTQRLTPVDVLPLP